MQEPEGSVREEHKEKKGKEKRRVGEEGESNKGEIMDKALAIQHAVA